MPTHTTTYRTSILNHMSARCLVSTAEFPASLYLMFTYYPSAGAVPEENRSWSFFNEESLAVQERTRAISHKLLSVPPSCNVYSGLGEGTT